MRRKTFIKYLMGHGLPRNKSNQVADRLCERNVPYCFFVVCSVEKRPDGRFYVEHEALPENFAYPFNDKPFRLERFYLPSPSYNEGWERSNLSSGVQNSGLLASQNMNSNCSLPYPQYP